MCGGYGTISTTSRFCRCSAGDRWNAVLSLLYWRHSSKINAALGVMYELKMIAVSLMLTPIGNGSNATAGPSFEYVQVLFKDTA
jgi:hypothetical protein